MKFNSPLIRGKLKCRYKRFLADVQLEDGSEVTAHCPNTGAMTGCAEPGWMVYLSQHNNPKRKLAYSWEMVENHRGELIGINTHNANKLVGEALAARKIDSLSDYKQVRPEVAYGEQNSRIDFLLSGEGLADCYIEVKSVTLAEEQQGYFPDTVSTRAHKHLQELIKVMESGHDAVLIYVVQHQGIKQVSPATHIDPLYARLQQQAVLKGLKILVYNCALQGENYLLDQQLAYKSG